MVGLMAMFFPVLLMLSTLALQRVETQLGPQRLRTSSLHPDRCSASPDPTPSELLGLPRGGN